MKKFFVSIITIAVVCAPSIATQPQKNHPIRPQKISRSKTDTLERAAAPKLATRMDVEAAQLTPAPSQQTITIKNSMTDPLPAYAHWSGTYKPEIFTLSVNGKEIKLGESVTVTTNKPLEVTYYSKFQNGRETHKMVTLDPQTDQKECCITFDWHDKYRVKASNAKPQKVTVVK